LANYGFAKLRHRDVKDALLASLAARGHQTWLPFSKYLENGKSDLSDFWICHSVCLYRLIL